MSGVEQLLEALAAMQVKFVVIGTYAAIMQGSNIGNQDLDICYERTEDNHKKIIRALTPFNPRPTELPETHKVPFSEHFLAQASSVNLVTDLGYLDLHDEISGVGGYAQIINEAKTINLGRIVFQVASLDTIIRSKEAADRPKDRATLPELKALRMIQQRESKEKR